MTPKDKALKRLHDAQWWVLQHKAGAVVVDGPTREEAEKEEQAAWDNLEQCTSPYK